MDMKIYNRATMIVGSLEKGVEFYLDHFKEIQDNNSFPINSNEEMYKAESIIHRIVTMQNAILLAEREDSEYINLLFDSLKNICNLVDQGYSDYFEKIDEVVKKGLA